MSFNCKTCGAKLRVRTSSEMSPNVRAAYYECTNPECYEEYAGSHILGNVVRPSKKRFQQMSIELFLNAIPEAKRAAVLNLINS